MTRAAGVGSELDKPLGQDRRSTRASRGRWGRTWRGPLLGSALAFVVVAGSLYAALLPNPIGKDNLDLTPPKPASHARASATASVPAAKKVATEAPRTALPKVELASPSTRQDGLSGAVVNRTLTANGLTVTTITPGRRDTGGPVVIEAGRQVGQDTHVATQPDPNLYTETKYGKLPVRGPDGTRPMDVYARPAPDGGGARVAIVVGGLGLSQTGTLNAIDTLPPGVTLAFASTGNSLGRWMQAARQDGHEILLQVPMEPFGYPQTDPGPHTLTVKGGTSKEMDDLHYAMGRITNYTGIVNYMGGRLMADADAMEPMMRDIAKRGLLFLDDGSSAQSLTRKLAPTLKLPYATADVQLDGEVDDGAIMKRLDELEQIARRNGSAIGVASAFDQSVQTIAAWAAAAKARGIEIVGVSNLVDDPERNERG